MPRGAVLSQPPQWPRWLPPLGLMLCGRRGQRDRAEARGRTTPDRSRAARRMRPAVHHNRGRRRSCADENTVRARPWRGRWAARSRGCLRIRRQGPTPALARRLRDVVEHRGSRRVRARRGVRRNCQVDAETEDRATWPTVIAEDQGSARFIEWLRYTSRLLHKQAEVCAAADIYLSHARRSPELAMCRCMLVVNKIRRGGRSLKKNALKSCADVDASLRPEPHVVSAKGTSGYSHESAITSWRHSAP